MRLASRLVAAALIANLFITGGRPEMAGLPAPWDKLAHFAYVLAVLLMNQRAPSEVSAPRIPRRPQ